MRLTVTGERPPLVRGLARMIAACVAAIFVIGWAAGLGLLWNPVGWAGGGGFVTGSMLETGFVCTTGTSPLEGLGTAAVVFRGGVASAAWWGGLVAPVVGRDLGWGGWITFLPLFAPDALGLNHSRST